MTSLLLHPGLVSVTFRQLSPSQIVNLVATAGLQGIEWGGDVHVPHGDLARAREVTRLTREAGLAVAAYGSYYRLGESETATADEKLEFARVLETAVALGAPTIRVWAGRRASTDTDAQYRVRVVENFQRVAAISESEGITVACEFHGGTLTDTAESTRTLLEETAHPNAGTYWQPPANLTMEQRLAGLRLVRPWLTNIHVFNWQGWPPLRYPLREGAEEWERYFEAILENANVAEDAPQKRWALLEFVEGDDPQAFIRDADTLKNMLECD